MRSRIKLFPPNPFSSKSKTPKIKQEYSKSIQEHSKEKKSILHNPSIDYLISIIEMYGQQV